MFGEHSFRGASGKAVGQLTKDNELFNFFFVEVDKESNNLNKNCPQSKEKRWYALKDKKLRCRAKGTLPQVREELTLSLYLVLNITLKIVMYGLWKSHCEYRSLNPRSNLVFKWSGIH